MREESAEDISEEELGSGSGETEEEEDEEDEPVDGVYMTIEGGNRKTSITPPLLL